MAGTVRESKTLLTAEDKTAGAFASFQRNIAQAQAGIMGMQGMLAGLAGGAVIGGFATLIKSTLDHADALNKMAQKTGIAASELSKLSYAAKLSDVSNETVTKGIKGLSEMLVKAADATSYQATVFRELGINIKGGVSPAMDKIADQFAKLPDGATKTALAVELFGKAGQEMIPMLNKGSAGLAEMKDEAAALGLTISNDTAEAAEKFNDNLRAMKTGAEATGTALVTRMAAGLADVTTAMKEAQKEGGLLLALWVGLGGAAAKIFTDDSLSEAEKTQKKIDELNQHMAAYKARLTDALEVQGKWGDNLRNSIITGIAGTTKELTGLYKALADIKRAQSDREDARIDAEAAKEVEEDRVRLIKVRFDAAKKAQDEINKWNEKLRQEDIKGWVAYAEAVFAEADKLNQDLAKISEEYWKNEEKLRQEDLKGWVAYAQHVFDEADKENIELAKINGEYWKEQDKLRDDELVKHAALYDRMAGFAGDFFGDLVVNGKSAFDSLRSALKQFAAEIIAFFAKRYILQMVAGSAGLFGATAANAASTALTGQSGSLLGTALNAGSSFLGASLFGGSAAYGASVSGLSLGGTQAALLAEQTGVFGASGLAATAAAGGGTAGSLASSLAAAGPYIALALAAYAIYKAISKPGGPKTGGSYSSSVDALGAITGSSPGWYGVSDQNAAVQGLTGGSATAYAAYLKMFGGSGTATFTQGFDSDPRGTAPNRNTTDAFVNGQSVYHAANYDLGRDAETLKASLQLEASRALLAALQASTLPKDIADLFNSVTANGATQEAIDALFASATELNTILQSLAGSTIKDLTIESLKAFQAQGESLIQTFDRVNGAMASLKDLFATDAERLAAEQQAIADAFASINQAVPDSIDAFKALVSTLDLNSESGRALFDVLVRTGPAFKDVQDRLGNLVSSTVAAATTAYQVMVSLNDLSGINIHTPGTGTTNGLDRSGLIGYLQGSQIGNLSPLSPLAQLAAARDQYQQNLLLAQGGDQGAINNFGGLRDQYLGLARGIYASSGAYNDIFASTYNQGAALSGGAVGPLTAATYTAGTQSIVAAMNASTNTAAQTTAAVVALASIIADGIQVSDPGTAAKLDEVVIALRSNTPQTLA